MRRTVKMNLLSPSDIILAVRRRSVCSTPVGGKVDVHGIRGGSVPREISQSSTAADASLSKKEKRRRSSLCEQSPTRKASFFQRYLNRGSQHSN